MAACGVRHDGVDQHLPAVVQMGVVHPPDRGARPEAGGRRAADESGAEITISGDWPLVTAGGDELTRLFQNLIGNAIKYRGPDVRPMISVSVQSDGAAWRFAVHDNGIGIDPAETERLFQVFQRLKGSEKYEGTGIGLAVCRKIVERHGGRIWVASEGVGKGTAFFFTLPKIADQGEETT